MSLLFLGLVSRLWIVLIFACKSVLHGGLGLILAGSSGWSFSACYSTSCRPITPKSETKTPVDFWGFGFAFLWFWNLGYICLLELMYVIGFSSLVIFNLELPCVCGGKGTSISALYIYHMAWINIWCRSPSIYPVILVYKYYWCSAFFSLLELFIKHIGVFQLPIIWKRCMVFPVLTYDDT